jgi:hypothetical protein
MKMLSPCALLLCLSGSADDRTLRLFGFKAYRSTMIVVLLPLLWLLSATL